MFSPILQFPSCFKLIVKEAAGLQFIFFDDLADLLCLGNSEQAFIIASKEIQRVSESVVTSERVALGKATCREQLIQFKEIYYYEDVVQSD